MLRKPLFLAAITTAALCAPALADTPKAPPAPPAPPAVSAVSGEPSQTLRLTLVVKAGNDTRTHELAISDRGCGNITEKTTAYQDEISVCIRPTGTNLQIDTSWQTRVGVTEYRTRWEAIMPRTGGTAEVGRVGANRLSFTLR